MKPRLRRFAWFIGIPFLVGGFVVVAGLMKKQDGIKTSYMFGEAKKDFKQLASIPETLDFGVLSKALRKELIFHVVNSGETTIEVSRLETSCDCVEVILSTHVIPRGKTIQATAQLDLSESTTFSGKLHMTVNGFDQRGNAVLQLLINVEVV